ncbi:MAG: Membrane protein, distant similarity to thiosulphate:quinone oxidoreductase DoxD, partial [uncultured Truepera sp.]
GRYRALHTAIGSWSSYGWAWRAKAVRHVWRSWPQGDERLARFGGSASQRALGAASGSQRVRWGRARGAGSADPAGCGGCRCLHADGYLYSAPGQTLGHRRRHGVQPGAYRRCRCTRLYRPRTVLARRCARCERPTFPHDSRRHACAADSPSCARYAYSGSGTDLERL